MNASVLHPGASEQGRKQDPAATLGTSLHIAKETPRKARFCAIRGVSRSSPSVSSCRSRCPPFLDPRNKRSDHSQDDENDSRYCRPVTEKEQADNDVQNTDAKRGPPAQLPLLLSVHSATLGARPVALTALRDLADVDEKSTPPRLAEHVCGSDPVRAVQAVRLEGLWGDLQQRRGSIRGRGSFRAR